MGFTMAQNARFATLRFANIAHRILMTKNAMLGIITAPSARPHSWIITIPTALTAVQKWVWRIIMAHDFLGNELSIGDDVVFLNYNGTSASLEHGKITKVSEHTAEISGKRRAEYKIIKVNPVKPIVQDAVPVV